MTAMGLFSVFRSRVQVLRIGKRGSKIISDSRKPLVFSLHSWGKDLDTFDKVGQDLADLVLTYNTPGWRHLRSKHIIDKEKLLELYDKLLHSDYVFGRSFEQGVFYPVVVMDFAMAVLYMLDFEDEIDQEELCRTALRYTLRELKQVPYKR